MSCWELSFAIIGHELGITSNGKSSACRDYVPALCTHRPSLLQIDFFGEPSGLGLLYAV